MNRTAKIVFELIACTLAGALVWVVLAAIGTYVTWQNQFTADDAMRALRFLTAAGFLAGAARIAMMVKHSNI